MSEADDQKRDLIDNSKKQRESCCNVFLATFLSCGLGTFMCTDISCALKCCRVDLGSNAAVCFGICSCLSCCGYWSNWARHTHTYFNVKGEFMR